MRSDNNINKEYLDFCGENELDFARLDEQKWILFSLGISAKLPFSQFADWFQGDLDQLAYCAVYAFSKGRISRAATATFLEYRSMKKDFPAVNITDISSTDSSPEEVDKLMEGYFDYINDKQKCLALIQKMPRYEACLFSVSVPADHLPSIGEFLGLADNLKIIQKSMMPLPKVRTYPEVEEAEGSEESEQFLTATIGSVSVKNAITTAIYGEHAKQYYPRLGKFTIDMMGDSIENYGRYVSVDYPDVATAKSFHKIKSSPTYVTLHDEVHRRLTSTIPNPVYAAFLDAINLAREKTGMKWSKEIWDAMDMEVGEFLNSEIVYENYNANDIKQNTEYFARLLNANVYTENRPAALFTAFAYVDTTWLLMIDIALQSGKWRKKGIDLSTLPITNPYRLFYEFVLTNKDKIVNTSSAEQVAIIKSEWFGIPYKQGNEIAFKKEQIGTRYIQVKVDDNSVGSDKEDDFRDRRQILQNKSIKMVLKNADKSIENASLAMLLGFIIHDPHLFNFIYESNQITLPGLFNNRKFSDTYSHFKAAMTKAFVDFSIQSISDLLKILKNVHNAQDKNEFILQLLKKDQGFGRLSWNLSDLYTLIKLIPEYKQEILSSVLSSTPGNQDLLLLMESNLEEVEKSNKHLPEIFGFLEEHELFTRENILLLLDNMQHVENLNKAMLQTQGWGLEFHKEAIIKLLANLQYLDVICECLDQVRDMEYAVKYNIALILENPVDAKNTLNKIIEKEKLRGNLLVELVDYINDSEIKSGSIQLFTAAKKYANPSEVKAAQELIYFLRFNQHNRSQDLYDVVEPNSFLESIVNRCRDGGIKLPKSLGAEESLSKSFTMEGQESKPGIVNKL